MGNTRINFTATTRWKLAMSANFRCVRPGCGLVTHFYDPNTDQTINIQGQGAHVHGASSGGPRHDVRLTDQQIKSFENGIWLCANCATLIDRLPQDHPSAMLKQWQLNVVERIRRTGLGANRHIPHNPREDSQAVQTFLEKLTSIVLPGWHPGLWISNEALEALKHVQRAGQVQGPGNTELALQHSIRNRQVSICELAYSQIKAIYSFKGGYESTTSSHDNYLTGYKPTRAILAFEDEVRCNEIRRLHDELKDYLSGPPMTLHDADW